MVMDNADLSQASQAQNYMQTSSVMEADPVSDSSLIQPSAEGSGSSDIVTDWIKCEQEEDQHQDKPFEELENASPKRLNSRSRKRRARARATRTPSPPISMWGPLIQ